VMALSFGLLICLFVCHQCVCIGHWPEWPCNAVLLAPVSGSTGVPDVSFRWKT